MQFLTKPTLVSLVFVLGALGATSATSRGSAALEAAETTVRKCGGRNMPGYGSGEAVAILDGVVLEKGQMSKIESADIDHIDVTCWDPETGQFHPPVPTPGVGVVLVWTKVLMQTSTLRLEDLLVHSEDGTVYRPPNALELRRSGRQYSSSVVGAATLSGSIVGHDGERESGLGVRVRDSHRATLTDERGHFVLELSGLEWPIEVQVVGVDFVWRVGGTDGRPSFIVFHGPKEAQARNELRRLYDAGGA